MFMFLHKFGLCHELLLDMILSGCDYIIYNEKGQSVLTYLYSMNFKGPVNIP